MPNHIANNLRRAATELQTIADELREYVNHLDTLTTPTTPPVTQTCWRAPNPHPPHPWQDDNGTSHQCPGVKGTTMY